MVRFEPPYFEDEAAHFESWEARSREKAKLYRSCGVRSRMNTRRHALSFGAALLLAACGSTAPIAESTPTSAGEVEAVVGTAVPEGETIAEGATDTVWIAGTPEFMLGEGYCEVHASATSADGPWTSRSLISVAGEALPAGQMHRVRVRVEEESPELMDGCGDSHVVLSILESVEGGPIVAVFPGVGAAGLDLATAARYSATVEMGSFSIGPGAISFHPADVGVIRVGDTTVPRGSSLEDVAAAFEGCERQANRGGIVYTCNGAIISRGGPTDAAEAVEIRIVAATGA